MWASLIQLLNRLLGFLERHEHKRKVEKQEADIKKIKENPRDFFNQGNTNSSDTNRND